jgi:uncharacterized protein (DUF1778 family)
MTAMARNDDRLNFRLPGELKRLIEQAATASGQSVSQFAVSTLVRNAREVIQHHDRTELSNRDRDIFLTMLDDVDAQPNAALSAAAKEYERQIG